MTLVRELGADSRQAMAPESTSFAAALLLAIMLKIMGTMMTIKP